jgi:hypothetical protein
MSFGQSNIINLSTYALSSIASTSDDIPLALTSSGQCPISLISVGTLQKHYVFITFSYQKKMITFPMDYPELTGLSFDAIVHCQLSLLDLDFIPTPTKDTIPAAPMLACPVFPVVSITTDLWHCCLGHLGQDATWDMLSQDFVTGITLSVSSPNIPMKCIPCLIGKSPQTPY